MNAREAYEMCGLAATERKNAEQELMQFVDEHIEEVSRLFVLLTSEGSALLSSSKLNRGDLVVLTASAIMQLCTCIEKIALKRSGDTLARDN